MADSWFMSYDSAVAQMYALGHELAQMPAHKFDLTHMRVLLAALGHPEKRFPSVLIAGTNGKGSTAATLASILEASQLKTGLYTSPHLISINERMRLDGQPIADPDFTRVHDEVEEVAGRLVANGDLPWHPSFFEMLTAMAFEHFARIRSDMVVLEVGMGGRLDATNVVEPRVSIITDIALDHQKYLGTTVSEIAREKVGIIRPGAAVVTLPQSPEANAVIGNTILDLGARTVNAVQYVPPVSPGSTQYPVPSTQQNGSSSVRQWYPLEVLGERIMVESPLVGRHQLRNIALAIAAAEQLHHQGLNQITPTSIERGIRATHWPGRFQVLPSKDREPEYVFDVAHNPAGAWALRSTLSAVYGDRPFTMVFGVMRDKAVSEIAEILFPVTGHVIATHADNPRSATPDEIRQAASRIATDIQEAGNVASALDTARRIAGPGGLVVITGSIYIVGEAMRELGVRI
jgi:dihydrofolate synthase/folylpolyglutamate synthase